MQSIMKVGGVCSEKEAVNFLLGKVGEPHITSYINHVSRKDGSRRAMHAIVPDIHATNFPVGRQRVNDSGSRRDAEAIFEIKTFTACKLIYGHNNNKMSPVSRRAKMVVQSYNRKFKKLDNNFAANVAGDGNNVNDNGDIALSVIGPRQDVVPSGKTQPGFTQVESKF